MQPQSQLQQDNRPITISQSQQQQKNVYSLPLHIRIKNKSWAVRKQTYEQVLYLLQQTKDPHQEILISGQPFSVQTLTPHFQNLVYEKHTLVLLKGLECIEQIIKLDNKQSTKHCIKTLIDKGLEIFPLISQQRKAILEKFLDIIEMSRIDSNFLKGKLELPHQKSVMYVIEVIGILNMSEMRQSLLTLSRKHAKKCVRELAQQVADELQQYDNSVENNQQASQNPTSNLNSQQQQHENFSTNPNSKSNFQSKKAKNSKNQTSNPNPNSNNRSNKPSSTCRVIVDKLPLYDTQTSKDQQVFSCQLLDNIQQINQEYSHAQLPNFSHFIRLMIDDNNHIINTNGMKCLIVMMKKETMSTDAQKWQKQDSYHLASNGSLVPSSFPLLFLFAKFKSHKTHTVNLLVLQLVQTIAQTQNRVHDLFLAISQGIHSVGSKMNVKYGCTLSFFRCLSLFYQNQDLYTCTVNEFSAEAHQEMQDKFQLFSFRKGTLFSSSNGRSIQRLIQKIISTLGKDKKYQTELYLVKNALGIGIATSCSGVKSPLKNNTKLSMMNNNSKAQSPKIKNTSLLKKSPNNNKANLAVSSSLPLSKSSKSSSLRASSQQGYTPVNLQISLSELLTQLNTTKSLNFVKVNKLIQKSTEQFYQVVKGQHYQMFYLCELLAQFIESYEPKDNTIEQVSEYLINLIKIISLLKPVVKNTEIQANNICEILKVALCKLALGQEILEILENLNLNYEFGLLLDSIVDLVKKGMQQNSGTKIKKKNKKNLILWLESNTPQDFLDDTYFQCIEKLKQKQLKAKKQTVPPAVKESKQCQNQVVNNQKIKEKAYKANQEKIYSQSPFQQRNPFKNTANQFQNISPYQLKNYRNQEQNRLTEELQNIQLSKIQQNNNLSHEYDVDKSSFQQNIEEHFGEGDNLKTNCKATNVDDKWQYFLQKHNIPSPKKTYKEEQEDDYIDEQGRDKSREYLRMHVGDKFSGGKSNEKSKEKNFDENIDISQSQYFTKVDNGKASNKISNNNIQQQRQQQQFQMSPSPKINKSQIDKDLSEIDSNLQIVAKNTSMFEQKYQNRQKERFQFMNQMKNQHKPSFQIQNFIKEENDQKSKPKSIQNNSESKQKQPQNQQSDQQDENQHFNAKNQIKNLKSEFSNQKGTNNLQKNVALKTSPSKSEQAEISKDYQQSEDLSSSCIQDEQGRFRYKMLNAQKILYMLSGTNNPYPHLRTLILIPFKSSNKKHHFLKELLHFYSSEIKFTIPQPFNSLVLLTILLFSQIKQDKTLIQPLQALYEYIAKQVSTNQFVRTLINLFHSVIEQTLPQNRNFLITVLLKSLIRMLPFAEDGLSLLRDFQQFYQIGQMVYFEMFEEEYAQIRTYIQEDAVEIVVEKALNEGNGQLGAIVQSWLGTAFKTKVEEVLAQFEEQESQSQQQHHHQQLEQKRQQLQQKQYIKQQHHQFKSYI